MKTRAEIHAEVAKRTARRSACGERDVPLCASCIAYVRRIADGAVAAAERDGTVADARTA